VKNKQKKRKASVEGVDLSSHEKSFKPQDELLGKRSTKAQMNRSKDSAILLNVKTRVNSATVEEIKPEPSEDRSLQLEQPRVSQVTMDATLNLQAIGTISNH